MEDGGHFAVVALPKLTPLVFAAVRDYLYTDSIDVRRWQAPAVARAARALGLPLLARAAGAISLSRRPELESSFVEDMRSRGIGSDSVRRTLPPTPSVTPIHHYTPRLRKPCLTSIHRYISVHAIVLSSAGAQRLLPPRGR